MQSVGLGERLIGRQPCDAVSPQGVTQTAVTVLVLCERELMYMLNLRVVGMDVVEIQIDSTSDWTRRNTNAACHCTSHHLVGNKRPNKAHVANTTCLMSKLLPQPVTEPGCNLRLDSHADKLCEPVRASSPPWQRNFFASAMLP